MILYFAADLIWASKVKATADALRLAARPVRSIDMLEQRLADSPVVALLVDLDDPRTALALIHRLRNPLASERDRAIHILAWGPHVAMDAFEQARLAGANEFITRGAFDKALPDILSRLARSRRLDEPPQ